MSQPPRKNTRSSRRSDSVFGYLIPTVLIGLAVAQFVRDGQIDKYLIGALLIFGLGALGYRVDTLLETYITARAALQDQPSKEAGNAGDQPGANDE